MIVDYLRTCYKAPFELDDANHTRIQGVFYRPPMPAQVYRDLTYIRSSVWDDPWDQFDGPGDIFAESEYYNGQEYVLTDIRDRRRTALAATGCDKPLALVAGRGGMPFGCEGLPIGTFGWTQVSGQYRHFPDGSIGLISGIFPQQILPYRGGGVWSVLYPSPTGNYLLKVSFIAGRFLASLTTTFEGLPADPLTILVDPGDIRDNIPTGFLPMAPEVNWIDTDPPDRVTVNLQHIVP